MSDTSDVTAAGDAVPPGDPHPVHSEFDRDAERPDAADERVTAASAGPIDPEAEAAAEGLTVTGSEAAAYRDHIEKGANVEGEGRFA